MDGKTGPLTRRTPPFFDATSGFSRQIQHASCQGFLVEDPEGQQGRAQHEIKRSQCRVWRGFGGEDEERTGMVIGEVGVVVDRMCIRHDTRQKCGQKVV